MTTPASALEDPQDWATQTFGDASLGDTRRTARLVRMATVAAARPAGKITQVYQTSADRQGAYGFLENPAVTAAAVATADHRATVRLVAGAPFAFVAVDGSSFRVTDRCRRKGTGRVGTRGARARGFQVQSAVVVRADGTPLGLSAQDYWARTDGKQAVARRKRKAAAKETRFWGTTMATTTAHFAAVGAGCRPWFQLDRGGDSQTVLGDALAGGRLVTVRAAQNRRLAAGPHAYLWDALAAAPVVCTYALAVPARAGQAARAATMVVRACVVTLRLRNPWTKTVRTATLWAVQAQEVGAPPGVAALCWRLLTTWPVTTEEDACLVVFGYSQRWRVEEFHRTWKAGGCHVEDTELRSAAAIQTWAVVLASVAMRAVRLAYRAREEPAAPATCEFTPAELDAVIVLKRPPGVARGDVPPLAQVVTWVAELGGYVGTSSGGPPGPTVITRGLKEVKVAVQTLANLKVMEK